jgi:hypothetical protein
MPEITIEITPEIAEAITRDVRGEGGFQDLLRKLQGQLEINSMTLTLTGTDLEKIPRYKSYEPGGYENRLEPLLALLTERHHI